jgi:hypothetical protein
MSGEPRSGLCRWREGLHWQLEAWRIAAWFGVAGDRWMIGVIVNTEGLNLGFGLGPFYFGAGIIRG